MNDSIGKNDIDALRWGERLGFGVGCLGFSMIFLIIGTYLTIYLTNVAFLDIAVVSTIIAVSKVFDGISDVIVGNLIDNTRSRFGKARIWLLRMCLPFAIAVILLFYVPPGMPQIAKYIYVFLMYNLASTVCYTFLQISHFSLISLMTDDREEKGRLGIITSFFANLAALIGGALFVKLLLVFTSDPHNQNTQRAYTGTILVYCLIATVLILICVFSTKERLSSNKTEAEKAEDRVVSYGLKETLKAMLSSKYWRIMISGQLLICTAMQLLVAGAAYFALYVLGDMDATSWMLATQMLPSMVILFIAPALMKRFGKVKLFTVGILLLAVGCVGFGLTIHSKTLMIFFCVVKGIGIGLNSGMTYGIIADMISHTRQETGIFAAGMGNAGTTAVNKLGQGVGNIMLGFTMSLAGFNGALKVQPAAVTQAVTAGFVWIPATIFIALFIVFVLFFDLDKVMKG